ncbi:MAG TPA: c-type cytochrome [Vicinamibacterales bacterium]|nr:c-type cytochrome [Vicinamibacterales bacterium]
MTSPARPFSRRVPRLIPVAASAFPLSACSGIQSSLAPSGSDAARVATLFWWMTIVSLVVWIGVIALALYYSRRATGSRNERRDRALIIGGGVVLPGVTVTILLVYGLAMLPSAVARAPEGSLLIDVVGEQWWWRVRYLPPDGREIVLANEVRLPVGEAVQFRLSSDNVIHSFWIPSLAGKMDMIPGRVTYLTVRPTATGVLRGACAEYCGTSHALMAFYAEVMEKSAFNRWLDQQAAAAVPVSAEHARGEEVFRASGCQACHTVRGTDMAGVIGPDLTHVGSRLSVGAGILPNDADAFRRWIASTEHVKPGVHMPQFGMLPDEDLRALAAYLEGLQ